MGSWGVGIFSNDLAEDVRDGFRDLIAGGVPAEAATEQLQHEYGVGSGGEVDNDFWLSLAATQHQIGHVVPGVIERARQIIADPAELGRWDTKDRSRRLAALEKLRIRLSEPAPVPKRIRVRKRATTSLEAGQHVVFDVPGAGPVLLRIDAVQEDKGGQYPRAIAVQWDGREGSLKRADRLPPHSDPDAQRHPPSSARAVEGEALGFVLTGGDPAGLRVLPQRSGRRTPVPAWSSAWVTPWAGLARWFVDSATVKRPGDSAEP